MPDPYAQTGCMYAAHPAMNDLVVSAAYAVLWGVSLVVERLDSICKGHILINGCVELSIALPVQASHRSE